MLKRDTVLVETDLCTAVTRKSVVPETLVRTGQWLLIVVVVAMCGNSSCEAEKSWRKPHFDKGSKVDKELRR